ncbi:MAG: S8 family serine peptidase [Pyrinomonadaceae bacterium]
MNTTSNEIPVSSVPFNKRWETCEGKGVSIALIDSGVDVSHPALKGKIAKLYESYKDDKKISFRETDVGDSAGHGTACAGIISSLAPQAEITSIRVLGESGLGDGFAFLAGLDFAISQGFRVINLSLGTTKQQFVVPLRDLLDRAYQAGCVVVAAANNLPQPSFPSVFSSSLIAVSKSTEQDPLKFCFRFGHVIELVAPGVNVRTTWLNGGYKQLTGNSFACPHIVGIIARMLEADPNLTPFEVKSILYRIANENRKEIV